LISVSPVVSHLFTSHL